MSAALITDSACRHDGTGPSPHALLAREFERTLISYRAKGSPLKSVASFRETCTKLVVYLREEEQAEPTLEHFTLDAVEEWICVLEEDAAVAHESVRSHARRIRAISRRMHRRGQLTTHVLAALETPEAERRDIFVPSNEQVEAMLAVCDRATKSGRMDRALIACFADGGPRRSELIKADVSDVDLELGVIRIGRPAKSGLKRWAMLGRESREALRIYLGLRTSGPLFLDRRFNRLSGSAALHRVADASVRAGLDRRIGPQLLRRFAATRMAAHGASDPVLFRVMGWEPDPKKVAYPAYINLTAQDLSMAFGQLSPVDRILW